MTRVTYYLPKELAQIIKTYKSDNIGLFLSKYVPFAIEKKENKSEPKKAELKVAVEKYRKYKFGVPEKAANLYELYLNSLKIQDAVKFKMKTKSRLIVGLGQESVYETSIRLHRNYGVPIIPGSALKGITKYYAIMQLAERFARESGGFEEAVRKAQEYIEEPDTKKIDKLVNVEINTGGLTIGELRQIFGTQANEGEVIFFDALPEPNNLQDVFELDIMNPHYQPYYSGSEPPGDWFDPNPIFFLTVREGVVFNFWIWQRREHNSNLLEKTKILLIEALKEVGVGAKTSLGYGRFEELK